MINRLIGRAALLFVGLLLGMLLAAALLTRLPAHATYQGMIFENTPGPDILTLQKIAGDASTDAEILDRVVIYFGAERNRLQLLWREDNPTRLAGLFTMYLVHISHPYGETRYPASLVDYLTLKRSHCGTYSLAQAKIAEALGLDWRRLVLSNGWHGWLEIRIDDHWEIFDSTVNVWIDRPAAELATGAPRSYRYFYTPLLDKSRPDARAHLDEGYDMQHFRDQLPGWGLFYRPPGEIVRGSRTL